MYPILLPNLVNVLENEGFEILDKSSPFDKFAVCYARLAKY